MSIHDEIGVVKGVGVKTKALLNKLGIETIASLLTYYPRTYDQYSDIQEIRSCKEGNLVVIYAILPSYPVLKQMGRKTVVVANAYDGSASLEVIWYNMPFLKSKLKKGIHYVFRGKVVKKGKQLSLHQPEILSEAEYRAKKQVLQPIYPLTKGITSQFFRKTIAMVVKEVRAAHDYLPSKIRKEHNLMGLQAAIEEIHFPKSYETLIEARKRMIFDEFFLFSLSIDRMKEEKEDCFSNFKMIEKEVIAEFLKRLPFLPTKAQMKVWNEIFSCLCSGKRLNSLIQGDVGSGKTLIALLSALLAAKNGFQTAVMVPTEVLAVQHHESFLSALSPFDCKIVLLTASVKGKERKEILEQIKNGKADIVIGTHALIQEKVEYHKLSLVITDEQHRFGVKQREKLMKKGEEPHVIVMSATPIPRTLALILYGDLSVSVIDELPKERLPIKNCVVGEEYRKTSYNFIREEVEKGNQAYIICPMIEQSEENDTLKDVISYSEELHCFFGDKVKVASLHGRMKNEEKNAVMEAFSRGEIDILVSTTVVEVGVNVPNATVMMIENSERFGLASLHQLRGRIGRGSKQSYCIFMTSVENEEARERLMILKNSNDGFRIAEEDMKLRGSGDIFGIRQSGDMHFQLGDVLRDSKLFLLANEVVKRLSDKSKKECYDRGRLFYQNSLIYGNEIHTL